MRTFEGYGIDDEKRPDPDIWFDVVNLAELRLSKGRTGEQMQSEMADRLGAVVGSLVGASVCTKRTGS